MAPDGSAVGAGGGVRTSAPTPATSPVRAGAPELFAGGPDLGIVLIHEIFGRDEYVRSVGRSLAEAGVSAAVVDLYDGVYARDVNEGMALRQRLTPETVLARLTEARDRLRASSPPMRVGTMGFCMGGGYALLGACRAPFDFCIDYYGLIEDADEVAHLRGPLLLVLGAEDTRINPWAYETLLPALNRHGRRVELQLYPGVRHAFHRPGWEGHSAPAAADAWARTLDFLRRVRAAPA